MNKRDIAWNLWQKEVAKAQRTMAKASYAAHVKYNKTIAALDKADKLTAAKPKPKAKP